MNTIPIPLSIDPLFLPIDEPNSGLPPFVVTMLKLCQIITNIEPVKREIKAETISRWTHQFRNILPCTYTGLEIRELFLSHGCYLAGGGVIIEGYELDQNYRSAPHYNFTFKQIFQDPALFHALPYESTAT